LKNNKHTRPKKIAKISPRKGSQTRRAFGASEEAEEIVLAIRRGGIDALVMEGARGEKVVTLQGTEHPYRVLVESINDGAATLDAEGNILYANARFGQILNIPKGKLNGTFLQSNLSEGQREKLKRLIRQALHRSSSVELTLHATEGRPKLVRFSLRPLKDADVHRVGVVATELTELVEANEALKSNEESLRQLSARLLQLQDEERRHIARDLHDVTGQKLAVQSMALSGVLSRNSGLDPDSRRALKEALAWNKEVAAEIRTLSYLLHPPLLDELGLASAVNWYVAGFTARTGIVVETEIPADLQRLSAEAEVAIFRVLQESLTNVHRYSGSSKALIRMKSMADEIRIEIQDFGKGMNISRSKARNAAGEMRLGVGIQGMTERMRQLGGKLEITSSLNKGTMVSATIPLSDVHVALEAPPSSGPIGSPTVLGSDLSGLLGGAVKKRILIADDHEMLRRGVRNTLQTEIDLEICGEAVDGQDAVEKVKALQPDLVILDINMPVLNGLVAVRQILRFRPQTKVLVFSVHDSDQTIQEVHAAGAHGFISKGKDAQDLLRVVREILSINSVPASAPAFAN
jgi:two-component system NarL family sensor kinase